MLLKGFFNYRSPDPTATMLAQIIRFTLPSTLTISTPLFQELRQKAASAGATAQYYGYSVQTAAPLPKKRHEICWAISAFATLHSRPCGCGVNATNSDWPGECDRSFIISALNDMSTGDATSLLLQFRDDQFPNLEKALQASVCEFVLFKSFADLLSIANMRYDRLVFGSQIKHPFLNPLSKSRCIRPI